MSERDQSEGERERRRRRPCSQAPLGLPDEPPSPDVPPSPDAPPVPNALQASPDGPRRRRSCTSRLTGAITLSSPSAFVYAARKLIAPETTPGPPSPAAVHRPAPP